MNTTARTVMITGTSSGFGKATTEFLAAAGWNVVATMRDPSACDHFSSLHNVMTTRLDVREEASINDAIEAGIARFGKIDAVVNNAGGLIMGVFEAVSDAEARGLFETNTFGVMRVTRQILPHFRKQRSGLIVNITSAVALSPLPCFSIYVASKSAIEGFSEALAYELAPLNIRVKVVEPGAALTGVTSHVLQQAAALPRIQDYDRFIDHMNALVAQGIENGMPGPEAIGKGIADAVADDSNRLRYLVGEDAVELLKLRRAHNEEAFIEQLRMQYLPPDET